MEIEVFVLDFFRLHSHSKSFDFCLFVKPLRKLLEVVIFAQKGLFVEREGINYFNISCYASIPVYCRLFIIKNFIIVSCVYFV